MQVRYVFAALAAIAVAAPTIASAETTVIKRYGDDGFRGARNEMRVFHRHHFDRDRKLIIVKHRRHHHWD
jgi:hypothetical protein